MLQLFGTSIMLGEVPTYISGGEITTAMNSGRAYAHLAEFTIRPYPPKTLLSVRRKRLSISRGLERLIGTIRQRKRV